MGDMPAGFIVLQSQVTIAQISILRCFLEHNIHGIGLWLFRYMVNVIVLLYFRLSLIIVDRPIRILQ